MSINVNVKRGRKKYTVRGKTISGARRTPYSSLRRPTKRKSAKAKGNFVTQSFTVLNSTITVANNATFAEEFSPSLSNIEAGDLAAYTALYDQFRVTSITIDVQSKDRVNTNASTGGAGDVFPFRFYSVLDKTDLTPITVAEAMQYNNVQKRLSIKPHPVYRRYSPMVPVLLQDINANYMVQMQKAPWMQLSPQIIGGNNYDNTQIAFPGVKVISDVNTGDPVLFDFYITFVVQFKTKL